MATTLPESELTVKDYFGLPNIPTGDVFGIEFELEQLLEINDNPKHCREFTEDNSLRHGGMEFISHPITLDQTSEFFHDVLTTDQLVWNDKKLRCSERGSIHVHVNVKHFTIEQLKKFLRFYCILEPAFFDFVDNSRKNNIYCVPLAATQMPQYIQKVDTLGHLWEKWHKYTALNLKSVRELGTVEFRHLQATENQLTFDMWMNIIHQLKEASRTYRANLSWDDVHSLHYFVFGKPMELVEDIKVTYQEDVINRLHITPQIITARIKESKKCVA